MKLHRIAAIVAAAVTLAGCWMSKVPLLEPREAVFPIRDGTYVRINELDGKREQIVFRRRGAWYDVTVQGQGTQRLMFEEIDAGRMEAYAYMIRQSNDAYFYGAMVFRRRTIEEIRPDCTEDAQYANAVGVRANEDGECVFEDRESLLRALEEVALNGRVDYRIEDRDWRDPVG